MKCPVCNAELPDSAKFCGGCGTTLSSPPQQAPPAAASYQQAYPAPNVAPSYGGGFGASPIPAVKKRYKVLRLVAVVMKILAVVVGALLIIGGLVIIVAGAAASSSGPSGTFRDTGQGAFLGGLLGGFGLLIYGVFVFIFLYALAELIYVFMDIEENTRMTNEMLMGRK